MLTITVEYKLKWRIKDNPKYCWSICGKLFNLNRGNEIKKTLKGLTPGYYIGKIFVPLCEMKKRIEIIPRDKKSDLPF
jgi:hypothetical protein